ncbi:MAG: hypothetical protein LGB78_00760 [Sulfurovum sp.]|nr:hypothetical protein [Sulfurovum sp.]
MCDNTRIDTIMWTIVNLRHIGFILHVFDNNSDKETLGEIRQQFQERYKTPSSFPLLNQWFGIYRLMPLILIKEEYRKQKKELSGDIKTIKIIRDAVAHGRFSIEEKHYIFCSNDGKIKFTYEEFSKFIYRIENKFYKEDKKLSDILQINAHLKYVEFLLGIFDNSPHNPTLGEIRQRFEEKFETLPPSLDQYFGIYRLIPLILIKEEYKEQSREMPDDLKFVRNAVVHGRFSIEEKGYTFRDKSGKREVSYKYKDVNKFMREIEKTFHDYYKARKKRSKILDTFYGYIDRFSDKLKKIIK